MLFKKKFYMKTFKTPFLALCGVQLFNLCFWLSRLTMECSCDYSVHVFGCPVLPRNVHVIIQFMFLVVPSNKECIHFPCLAVRFKFPPPPPPPNLPPPRLVSFKAVFWRPVLSLSLSLSLLMGECCKQFLTLVCNL